MFWAIPANKASSLGDADTGWGVSRQNHFPGHPRAPAGALCIRDPGGAFAAPVSSYLGLPYTFHLQRNSAQLIRNVNIEVSVLAINGIKAGMLLISECLVLLGLGALLVVVEPLGTLIVVGILGASAWGFNRLTRGHIARSGETRRHTTACASSTCSRVWAAPKT